MNNFKNKCIFIIAILVIVLGIIIYSNKDDISKLIGINTKNVYNNSKKIICDKSKNQGHNKNILGVYLYNDTVSEGESGYCVTGTESTCETSDCIYEGLPNQCVAGTIIKYKVNDDEIYYFNVLHDDGGVMTVQENTNTVTCLAWGSSVGTGPNIVIPAIENATSTWTNVPDITYTIGETKFLKYPNFNWNDNIYTYCGGYNSCTSNSYTYGPVTGKARIITLQEATDLGCTTAGSSCASFFKINWSGAFLWTLNSNSKGNIWYITARRGLETGDEWTGPPSKTSNSDGCYNARAVIEIVK